MAAVNQKPLNTAQALLAHIALKTEALPLFGTTMLVRQWTASERIKYMSLIADNEASEDDELALLKPQAQIVALSLVDDKGKPLFPAQWQDNQPIFADAVAVDSLIENRPKESSEAFVAISKFNGVLFSSALDDEDADPEEQAAKN